MRKLRQLFPDINIAGQSMRAGGATALAEDGAPPHVIQGLNASRPFGFPPFVCFFARESPEKFRIYAVSTSGTGKRSGISLSSTTWATFTVSVGGLSTRSVQAKKKKLRDEFKVSTLHISEAELKRQLAAIDAQEAPSAATSAPKPAFAAAASGQRTIAGMFAWQKRARAPSLDDEIEEIPSFPKEPESSSDELAADEEEEPVPEQLEEQAREEHGNEVVDSIVSTDNIAEWVDTILDDAAPLEFVSGYCFA
ncbi:hypothetical protein B0H10DRAFT_2246246 [Mycena sp. CBHHK59/15]|nr:hypothetical protein B0H10DRAFT_2246246 [Mycena sp. CBHHK59/15]